MGTIKQPGGGTLDTALELIYGLAFPVEPDETAKWVLVWDAGLAFIHAPGDITGGDFGLSVSMSYTYMATGATGVTVLNSTFGQVNDRSATGFDVTTCPGITGEVVHVEGTDGFGTQLVAVMPVTPPDPYPNIHMVSGSVTLGGDTFFLTGPDLYCETGSVGRTDMAHSVDPSMPGY